MFIPKLKKIIQLITFSVSILVIALLPVVQTTSYAAENTSAIGSTEESLGGLFPNCRVGSNSTKNTASKSEGGEKIIGCIREVVNFIFVLAIFILIFRIIGYQIGVIVDTSGSGSGPVEYTRKALKDGIIGLLLIGAPVLFLNLINSSTTNLLFDFQSQNTEANGAEGDLNNNNNGINPT